jgi:hypothetical protein
MTIRKKSTDIKDIRKGDILFVPYGDKVLKLRATTDRYHVNGDGDYVDADYFDDSTMEVVLGESDPIFRDREEAEDMLKKVPKQSAQDHILNKVSQLFETIVEATR